MAKEHSASYKGDSAKYSVSIFQCKDWDSDSEQLAHLSCKYCKKWQECEETDQKRNFRGKQNVCYIAQDVENKLSPFIYGFSSGNSGSDFFVLAENAEKMKSVDKVRKRLLKKYKMVEKCRESN